jgi:hypothetical protein
VDIKFSIVYRCRFLLIHTKVVDTSYIINYLMMIDVYIDLYLC